jgi:hypothetical protein
MTQSEINKRREVNRVANLNAALTEQREAGKRYFDAAEGSREEAIAWDDLCWATTKVKALEEQDRNIKRQLELLEEFAWAGSV